GVDAVFGMLEHGVSKAVANDIGRCAPGGQWRRGPELPGLLVADIECLPGGVLDGIVAPGRQSKLVGVLRPSVCAAGFGDNRAKRRIGEHIDPRGRSHLASLEGYDVLVAVACEAA